MLIKHPTQNIKLRFFIFVDIKMFKLVEGLGRERRERDNRD